MPKGLNASLFAQSDVPITKPSGQWLSVLNKGKTNICVGTIIGCRTHFAHQLFICQQNYLGNIKLSLRCKRQLYYTPAWLSP